MVRLPGRVSKSKCLLIVMFVGVCFLFSSLAMAGTDTEKAASGIHKSATSSAASKVSSSTPDVSPQGKININKADKDTLMKIKGLGPTKAQNIIDYREKFGPFKSYEDLLKVKGIGEKTLELIKPFITF